MKIIFHRYGALLIVLMILTWSFLTPIYWDIIYIVTVFTILIAMIITLLFKQFKLVERIVYGLGFGLLSFYITISLTLRYFAKNLFYIGHNQFFWSAKGKIIINLFFYGMNVFLVIAFILIFLLYKRARDKRRAKASVV